MHHARALFSSHDKPDRYTFLSDSDIPKMSCLILLKIWHEVQATLKADAVPTDRILARGQWQLASVWHNNKKTLYDRPHLEPLPVCVYDPLKDSNLPFGPHNTWEPTPSVPSDTADSDSIKAIPAPEIRLERPESYVLPSDKT